MAHYKRQTCFIIHSNKISIHLTSIYSMFPEISPSDICFKNKFHFVLAVSSNQGGLSIRSEICPSHVSNVRRPAPFTKVECTRTRNHMKCCCCSYIHLSCLQLCPTMYQLLTLHTYGSCLQYKIRQKKTIFIFLIILVTENDSSVTT